MRIKMRIKNYFLTAILCGTLFTLTACTQSNIDSVAQTTATIDSTTKSDNETTTVNQNPLILETNRSTETVTTTEPVMISEAVTTTETVTSKETSAIATEFTTSAEQPATLYESFLKNQSTVRISDSFYLVDNMNTNHIFVPSETYTLSELIEQVNQYKSESPFNSKIGGLSYAYLDCGADGKLELALRFQGMDIYTGNDDSALVAIITEQDGELVMTFGYEAWVRSNYTLFYYGLMIYNGSAGAGDRFSGISLLDQKAKFHSIYTIEELFGWWSSYIAEAAYASCIPDDCAPEICVWIYHFDDKELYCYEITEKDDEKRKYCENYIEACKEAGIEWLSEEEINRQLEAAEQALGLPTEVFTEKEVEWRQDNMEAYQFYFR